MNSPHIRPNTNANQRRSQRILLRLPVVISGSRSNGAAFSERTSTLVVNAHGALIQLRERVDVGQKLRMKNLATNEELSCTVSDINPGSTAIPEVGVAFSAPCPHFWRVSFPPMDWNSHNPEAKRYGTESRVPGPSQSKK